MQKETAFSNERIESFCVLSEGLNFNDLHRESYMEPLRKRPFVPGLLTAVYALSQAAEHLDNINQINLEFGSFLSSGEKAVFNYESRSEAPLDIILNASDENSRQLLQYKDAQSHLFMNTDLPGAMSETMHAVLLGGTGRSVGVTEADVASFADIVETSDISLASNIYPFVPVSKVLLEGIRTPANSSEEEIAKFVGDKLPVYRSLALYFPLGLQDYTPAQLDFTTAGFIEKRKSIVLRIYCKSQENPLYYAEAKFSVMRPSTLVELAKDLK